MGQPLLCPELWEAQPAQTQLPLHVGQQTWQGTEQTSTGRSHCVWTMTEKEQEELESGQDGFSGRKNLPEVPRECPSVPLDHRGSATPVLSQDCAWFREEHTVPLGSFLALPSQLSTQHRSHPKAGSCWERRLPGGQETPRRAGGPTVARAAALLQPGTRDNIPFPLQSL